MQGNGKRRELGNAVVVSGGLNLGGFHGFCLVLTWGWAMVLALASTAGS